MRRTDSMRLPGVEIHSTIDTRARTNVVTITTPSDSESALVAALNSIHVAEAELSAYLDARDFAPNPQETDR